MNDLWLSKWNEPNSFPLNFIVFDTKADLQAAYWRDPYKISLAVIFENPSPITQPLS